MESNNKKISVILPFTAERDDLPKMTFPLATLFVLIVSGTSAMAASVMFANVTDALSTIGGIVSSASLIALAVCAFTVLITLTRNPLSLLAAAGIYGVSVLLGAGFIYSAVFTVMICVSSVTFASLILKKSVTKFTRVGILAILFTLTAAASLASVIVVEFGTLGAFIDNCNRIMTSTVGELLLSFTFPEGVALTDELVAETAREMLLTIPGITVAWLFLMAWLCDFLTKKAYHVTGCANTLTDEREKLIPDKAFCIVYAGVIFVSLFTSADRSSVLYYTTRSAVCIMIIPCAYAGYLRVREWLVDRIQKMTKGGLIPLLLLLFLIIFIGIVPFLVFLSVLGAAGMLIPRRKKPEN